MSSEEKIDEQKQEEQEQKKDDKSEALMQLLANISERLTGLEAEKKQQKGADEEFEEFSESAIETQEKEKSEQKGKEPDFENMTARELAVFVVDHVNQNIAGPLLEKMETLRVRAEIAELKASPQGADFDDYKQDIYAIASKNPALTLKQALVLAKAGRTAKKAGKESGEPPVGEPPVSKPPIGARPGMSRAGLKSSGLMDLDKAAQEAYKQVFKE